MTEGQETDSTDLRALLEDVAAGRIEPGEAARLLDIGSRAGTTELAPSRTAQAPPTALNVDLGATALTLVADTTVATALVVGPHAFNRDGDVLRLSAVSPTGSEQGSYSVRGAPSTWQRIAEWLGRWGQAEMTVHVNPELDVDVSMTAGTVRTEGAVRLRTVRVAAGSIDIADQRTPLDLSVTAGSAIVAAEPTYGSWKLTVQGGSLRFVPGAASSATVRGEARLAEIAGIPETGELILGGGAADVAILATAGDVVVADPVDAS